MSGSAHAPDILPEKRHRGLARITEKKGDGNFHGPLGEALMNALVSFLPLPPPRTKSKVSSLILSLNKPLISLS